MMRNPGQGDGQEPRGWPPHGAASPDAAPYTPAAPGMTDPQAITRIPSERPCGKGQRCVGGRAGQAQPLRSGWFLAASHEAKSLSPRPLIG